MGRRDLRQRFHEPGPFGGWQGFQKSFLCAIGSVACAAQRLASSGRDGHGIRALIFFRTFAGNKFALEHATNHFGKRGAIDACHLDECGLADTFIVFERRKNGELLLGQLACAGFSRVEIAKILLASPNEMGWCFRKIESPIRSAPLYHSPPRSIQFRRTLINASAP